MISEDWCWDRQRGLSVGLRQVNIIHGQSKGDVATIFTSSHKNYNDDNRKLLSS